MCVFRLFCFVHKGLGSQGHRIEQRWGAGMIVVVGRHAYSGPSTFRLSVMHGRGRHDPGSMWDGKGRRKIGGWF